MANYSDVAENIENPKTIAPGEVSWKSPSNIAIVKYWGKYGNQLPRNASISLTLNQAHTITKLSYGEKKDTTQEFDLRFLFEGKENQKFRDKVLRNFKRIESIFPFLRQLSIEIESTNSFPHSSGIASSASSMSALALCLCEMEQKLFGSESSEADFLKKASFVSRLCSGSACRSVYPFVALWGKAQVLDHSSDYFAIDIHEQVHPVFSSFHDDILIVSNKEKSVSSTAGHALMDSNPYSSQRYNQASKNIKRLLEVMKEGDLDEFGAITESEALGLHALMMCSKPSYILMEPGTVAIIEKIRSFRYDTKIPVFFTLDAGPNVHILYPDSVREAVGSFIEKELKDYCQGGKIIYDQVGAGPSIEKK